MWWIYIVIGVVFLLVLISKCASYSAKRKRTIQMDFKGIFKRYSTLTIQKVNDGRKVIYYSQGPMNIKYDPSNFDLYRNTLIEIPWYVMNEKKTNKFGRGRLVVYIILLVIFSVLFVLSAVGIILNNFYPEAIEFLNTEALSFIIDYGFTYYFATGALACVLLTILFICLNRAYAKLFIYYMPSYLTTINNETYYKTMQPIYVKLN